MWGIPFSVLGFTIAFWMSFGLFWLHRHTMKNMEFLLSGERALHWYSANRVPNSQSFPLCLQLQHRSMVFQSVLAEQINYQFSMECILMSLPFSCSCWLPVLWLLFWAEQLSLPDVQLFSWCFSIFSSAFPTDLKGRKRACQAWPEMDLDWCFQGYSAAGFCFKFNSEDGTTTEKKKKKTPTSQEAFFT